MPACVPHLARAPRREEPRILRDSRCRRRFCGWLRRAARASAVVHILLRSAERMEWFDRLLDAAPDAITVIDATGRIVIVNAQAERMFGWPRQVLLGGHIELLIPERFHAAHMVHRARFHRARMSRPMGRGLTLCARRRDGSEFPVEISLSPWTPKTGR